VVIQGFKGALLRGIGPTDGLITADGGESRDGEI